MGCSLKQFNGSKHVFIGAIQILTTSTIAEELVRRVFPEANQRIKEAHPEGYHIGGSPT
jgi:hypothetical protein